MPLGFVPALPVETQRLRLRSFTSDDLDEFADMWRRSEVVRYLYQEAQELPGAERMLASRGTFPRFVADGDRLVLAVERQAEPGLLGEVVLAATSVEHRQGEIGFVFHPHHHGHGYGTEASRAMLAMAFDHVGFHRVVGRADGRNEASVALMRRLGMRREALFVQNEFVKGEWTDEVVYAILAEEWKRR